MKSGAHDNHGPAGREHYSRLGWMALLSFLAMFGLMYAMVDWLDNVLVNINQAYMAALMALPMVAIEVVVMGKMYSDRRLNIAILSVCVIGALAFWWAIREQSAVAEQQFLRSMIPHHAGAILMCEKANLKDAEVLALCRQIIDSQKVEIEQMKGMLADR